MKKMNLEEESKVRLFFFSPAGQWLSFSSPAQESHLNPVDSFEFLHLCMVFWRLPE